MTLCSGSVVQTLKSPMHIVCLILNIFLPGWGTMVSAFSCVHAPIKVDGEVQKCCSCGTFSDGMIQFYLFPLLFGWIWSIIFGIAIYKKGRDHHKTS